VSGQPEPLASLLPEEEILVFIERGLVGPRTTGTFWKRDDSLAAARMEASCQCIQI